MASISISSSSMLPIIMCVPIILCLTILPVSAFSQIWEPVSTEDPGIKGVLHGYPNPWMDPEQCGRTYGEEAWICDVDGVLSKEDADEINNLLTVVNTNASCVCNCSKNATMESGYVLAVAVVKTLEIDNARLDIEEYSDRLKQQWFIDKTCDDSGLILALFNDSDSEIFISLGEALDDLLSDQALPLIYKAIQPSLSDRELTLALNTTIQQLSSLIDEAITANTEPNNLVAGILGVITILSILLFHYWIKY
ncbi:uncharacterized protein LOC117292114 [Asterias rubens]|uniref:uncharacterized protein LOC117292114 n=1 Tax=Asterias rubens TaxID=7604 RepID=UPI00145520EF|nr:uncharacterized protein LOC117292114 [Asterias rubens]